MLSLQALGRVAVAGQLGLVPSKSFSCMDCVFDLWLCWLCVCRCTWTSKQIGHMLGKGCSASKALQQLTVPLACGQRIYHEVKGPYSD